jgi:hypothetical protein
MTARVRGRMGELVTCVGVKREGNSTVGTHDGERERVRERRGVIPGSVVACESGCTGSLGVPGRGGEGGDEKTLTTEDMDIGGSNNSREAGAPSPRLPKPRMRHEGAGDAGPCPSDLKCKHYGFKCRVCIQTQAVPRMKKALANGADKTR